MKRANPAEAEVQPAPVKRNATESAKEKIKTPKVKEKGKGVSFEEFMAVMQPKMKRKTWQNEDAAQGQSNNATTPADGQIADTTDKKAKKSKKSTRDQGASAAKKGTSSPAEPTAAPAEEDPAANDEGLTDLEYMRRRMRHKVGGDEESAEKAFEQSDSEAEDEDEGAAESGESVSPPWFTWECTAATQTDSPGRATKSGRRRTSSRCKVPRSSRRESEEGSRDRRRDHADRPPFRSQPPIFSHRGRHRGILFLLWLRVTGE